jgi:hypothetical protein
LPRPPAGPSARSGADAEWGRRHPTTARTVPGRIHPLFHLRELSMSRYLAPLGFAIATVWVAIVFVLISGH